MTHPFPVDAPLCRSVWDETIGSATSKEVSDKYWSLLQDLMAQPQRHYHNMFHMHLLTNHTQGMMTYW
jgi:predicted metal-dependent HD superfamily phosphohydrolase